MAALTSSRLGPVHMIAMGEVKIPVAASTTIYAGGLVSFDANGYLIPSADTAAQANKAIYYALEEVDNSAGANGDRSCRCMSIGIALLPVGPLVQADMGKAIHATDDQTLALTSSNSRIVGNLVSFVNGLAAVRLGGSY